MSAVEVSGQRLSIDVGLGHTIFHFSFSIDRDAEKNVKGGISVSPFFSVSSW
jgi:hypothetical protein